MDTANVSKPIWEMPGAHCDETAWLIGYKLNQSVYEGTWRTTATCVATGEEAAHVIGGYDEVGKRHALAHAAKHAGRDRVVEGRACVYLGGLPEPAAEATATTEPGHLSEPFSEMSDNELREAAVAIGYRLDPYRERDHWVTRWYEYPAGKPDCMGTAESLRVALYRSLQYAAKRAGRLREDGPTYRVWLGPLPEPEEEPAPQDAGQPEPEKSCEGCKHIRRPYDAHPCHHCSRITPGGRSDNWAPATPPEPAPKPVTCTCGRCNWLPELRCWYGGHSWTHPIGWFCPKCGCLLGHGIAHDPQAAMRRVKETWHEYAANGGDQWWLTHAAAVTALPVREATKGE